MPFAIVAKDKPGSAELRARMRPDHLSYLEDNLSKLIGAGALLDDDGVTAGGSLYLVDIDERAEAEAFIAADPYSKAGLFGEVEVTRWRRGILDHKSFLVKG